MLLVKKFPLEKVQGIVARGGGIPDPDAPQSPALTQFWVTTAKTQTDEEMVKQQSRVEIEAQTTPEAVGSLLLSGGTGPRGTGGITQQQLEQIAGSTQAPNTAGTL